MLPVRLICESALAQATDLGVARAQYEHAIAVLIGVPPAKFSLAVQPFNPALPLVPVSLPSDLLERRPDVAAAEPRRHGRPIQQQH